MSRKHKCRFQYNNGFGFPNFYMFLILILIVLQWFRVGIAAVPAGELGATPVQPEANLVNNGGLFIITLFILATCSCASMQQCSRFKKLHHCH